MEVKKLAPIDVAVVGGGIAGLYVAWRVVNDDQSSIVRVFEAGENTGGRLSSISSTALRFNANLGAMRYIKNQVLVAGLIDHFRLKTYEHDFPTRHWHLRGRLLRPNEYEPPQCNACDAELPGHTPYLLRTSEIGNTPAELVFKAISNALADLDFDDTFYNDEDLGDLDPHAILTQCRDTSVPLTFRSFTPQEWQAISRHGRVATSPGNRTRLHRMSFWEVLRLGISAEALHLIRDGLGYQSIIGPTFTPFLGPPQMR